MLATRVELLKVHTSGMDSCSGLPWVGPGGAGAIREMPGGYRQPGVGYG